MAQDRANYKMGLSSMSLNKRVGPMSQEEIAEHRELRKKLMERIRQLRMTEYIDDDEEPDVFIANGI